MDRIRTCLTFALALPLIGAIAVGCNSGTEEPAAPTTGSASSPSTTTAADMVHATPDKIDPSRFPELADGVVAAIPDNYPSDLPMYPGAVPAQGRGTSGDDGDMAAVQLLSNDSVDRTFDYYKSELESKGWSLEGNSISSENGSISATKAGCKATFMFIPSESGDGTDIFTISACDDDA